MEKSEKWILEGNPGEEGWLPMFNGKYKTLKEAKDAEKYYSIAYPYVKFRVMSK